MPRPISAAPPPMAGTIVASKNPEVQLPSMDLPDFPDIPEVTGEMPDLDGP